MRFSMLLAIVLVSLPQMAEGAARPVTRPATLQLIQQDFSTTRESFEKVGALATSLRQEGNRRALFAGIYALTIEAAHRKLEQKQFRNPAWVSSLIVNYANLYRRTILLELTGKRSQLPLAWQFEFAYIDRTVPLPKEDSETWSPDLDVVHGINVHIARDLVEALLVTPTDFSSSGIAADYFLITDALRGVMPRIWQVFRSYKQSLGLFRPLEQEIMTSWIADLRYLAWLNAAEASRLSAAGQKTYLLRLDEKTARRSRLRGLFLPLLPRPSANDPNNGRNEE